MVEEVLVGLNCRPARVYVDGTVGEGGHATAILDHCAPDGRLLGFDQDPGVLKAAAARLAPFTSRFHLFHRSYAQLGEILKETGVPAVAGILLDLGLSLHQLQRSGRGFSFQGNEPLDMRFNPLRPGKTAAEILNSATPAALEKVFKEYGEEIGRASCRERV